MQRAVIQNRRWMRQTRGSNAAAAEMNRYVGAVVTHTFGDAREVLDGDTISQWITVDGGNVTLDESQAAAYVKELAGKYDTAYKTKTLKTSYGKDVTISRGHYGLEDQPGGGDGGGALHHKKRRAADQGAGIQPEGCQPRGQ